MRNCRGKIKICRDARYEYNERSELTRVMWNDEVMFGYEYDQIGNLKWACVGCKTNVYEVNSLNQYTTITDSDGNVHQLAYITTLWGGE